MVNAVVLAGTHRENKRLIHGKNKAFLEINNKPLVSYVVDALKSSCIEKIATIGPKNELEKIVSSCEIIQESDNPIEMRAFVDNLIKSYNMMNNTEGILYLTSDIPLINSEIIDDTIKQCENSKADLCFMLTEEGIIPEEFSKLKTRLPSIKLDRKNYRLANMAFVEKISLSDIIFNFIGRSFSLRRPESADSKFGLYLFLVSKFPMPTLRYLAGTLKRDYVSEYVKKKFNLKLELIDTKSYETAVDIDYEEDFKFINYWMLKNQQNKK